MELGFGSRKGSRALMAQSNTTCPVMGNDKMAMHETTALTAKWNVYLCLPDLSAAVLIAGAYASNRHREAFDLQLPVCSRHPCAILKENNAECPARYSNPIRTLRMVPRPISNPNF